MNEKAERINGWAAMIGVMAAMGSYAATGQIIPCLLYTSPSPRDVEESRMPSSA